MVHFICVIRHIFLMLVPLLFCRLVGWVNDWCKELLPFGNKLGVVKPGGTNIVPLSKNGEILGLDGNALTNGHVNAEWKGGLLPFSDYCLTVSPPPIETVEAMVKERLEYEEKLINDMVGVPYVQDVMRKLGYSGGDGSQLHVIKLAKQGIENITAWFDADSHERMLTNHLPSTASMPDAVYAPDQIYKAV